MPPGAPIIKRILVYVEEHAKELKKAYPSIAWTADKEGGYFVVTGTVESLNRPVQLVRKEPKSPRRGTPRLV